MWQQKNSVSSSLLFACAVGISVVYISINSFFSPFYICGATLILNYFTQLSRFPWLQGRICIKIHALTLQASRRCRSQSGSSKRAASCPHPASARSMRSATVPSSATEPRSRPPSPSLAWSLTGCSPLPPVAPWWSEFAAEHREGSSPPPVRPCGWRAAAGRSARWAEQPSCSLHLDSTACWTWRRKTLVWCCALLKQVETLKNVSIGKVVEGAQVTVPHVLRSVRRNYYSLL